MDEPTGSSFSYNGEGTTSGGPEVGGGLLNHLWKTREAEAVDRSLSWPQPGCCGSALTVWPPTLGTPGPGPASVYKNMQSMCTQYRHTCTCVHTALCPHSQMSMRAGTQTRVWSKAHISGSFQALISCTRTLSQSMSQG